MATVKSPESRKDRPATGPVLAITKYDLVTAFMIAIGGALLLAAVTLIIIWLTNRIPEPPSEEVEIEFISAGGVADGKPNDTLNVESPEDVTEDPSVAEDPSEETQIEDVLETVMEVSDKATEVLQEQNDSASESTGKPGSAVGTGGKPLGEGNGVGGFPREQRWFVSFADKGSLKSYAKQLDFFDIELGVMMPPPDGQLIYLSKLSASPVKRVSTSGKGETRMYMNWQGGDRVAADRELFKKSNIDASQGMVLHFYDPKTEAMMAKLEKDYAGRPVTDIRRTYFQVNAAGSGYEFTVTKQTYMR